MKKNFVCSMIMTLVVSLSVVFAMAADKGPAELIMQPDGKKPVSFPHAKHQGFFDCATCHHGMKDGAKVAYQEGQPIQKCAECHTGDALQGQTLGKLKLDTIKGAGHGKCLACHKAKAKANADLSHLKKCSTCHIKAEKKS